ncbi:MAG: hypothetical protein P9X24_17695 [Candidatus Hatepunaea meridiana]|nr:hypothetical protein [Candidatus Hatepunaea meridiana]
MPSHLLPGLCVIMFLIVTPFLFAQSGETESNGFLEVVLFIVFVGGAIGLFYYAEKNSFEYIEGANTLTVRRKNYNRILSFTGSAIFAGFPWIYFNTGVFLLVWTLLALYPGIRAYTECDIKLNNNERMLYKNDKPLISYSDILSFYVKECVQSGDGSKNYYYIISIQTKTGRMRRMFLTYNFDDAEEIIVKMKVFTSRGR